MNTPSPRYVLDTNWMVDYLAGVETYRRKIEELGPGRLAISAVTQAELYEGIVHCTEDGHFRRIEGLRLVSISDNALI